MADKGNKNGGAEPSGGSTTRLPDAFFTGLEPFFLPAAFKAGFDLFGKGAEKGIGSLAEYIRREGPVIHRVLDSWFEGGYCVTLEFHNLTVHGAHLEEIFVARPKDIAIELAIKEPSGKERFAWVAPKVLLPMYLDMREPVRIFARMTDDRAKSLAGAKIAEISYRFSICDVDAEPNKLTKLAKCRLRDNGPIPFQPRAGMGLGDSG